MNIVIKPLDIIKELNIGFNIKKNYINKLKKLFSIEEKQNVSGGEDK